MTLLPRLINHFSRLFTTTMSVGYGVGLRFDPGPSNPRYASGDNELPVQEVLAQHLRKGDVLFDVGANVGFFTVIGARLVGDAGKVIAFEPVPANAALIRQNVKLNRQTNVELLELAVAEHTGESALVLAAYSGGSSLIGSPAPPDAVGSMRVAVVSIDDLIARGDAPTPALVKIDVEGAELSVLKGMSHTLTSMRPLVVYELDDCTPEGLEEKCRACREWLAGFDYEIDELPGSYAGNSWLVRHFLARPRALANATSAITRQTLQP